MVHFPCAACAVEARTTPFQRLHLRFQRAACSDSSLVRTCVLARSKVLPAGLRMTVSDGSNSKLENTSSEQEGREESFQNFDISCIAIDLFMLPYTGTCRAHSSNQIVILYTSVFWLCFSKALMDQKDVQMASTMRSNFSLNNFHEN